MRTKNNITYLIGAGASCEVLPLVRDFKKVDSSVDPNPISKMITMLEALSVNPGQRLRDGSEKTQEDAINQFIDDLRWLKNACQNYATVDTFAKKLYLTSNQSNRNKDDLKRLKICLAGYFMIEQYLKPPDKRYDTFFASIANIDLNREIALPSNIRIISWNYDIQFEKAYSPYHYDQGLSSLQSEATLNCYPNSNGQTQSNLDTTKFSIVKLNGTAGIHRTSKGEDLPVIENICQQEINYDPSRKIIFIMGILTQIELYKVGKTSTLLSFAWERKFKDGGHFYFDSVEQARKIVISTNILVIIGYSFPFFNREVDKELFNWMFMSEAFHKIYYQVHKDDVNSQEQRLRSLIGKRADSEFVEMRSDVSEFLIPPEFMG